MRCLDTCVCVDFLRGRLPLGLEAMQHTDPASIKIPAIVRAELLLGALKSRKPEENTERIMLFLSPFECIPFDAACATTYARVRAELEAQGTPIGPNDLIIAATTLARKATLVTNNIEEFKRIKELELESWHEFEA